ncbi:MAG: helix-turn-helix domain-containing protein [Halodesulfurarchaeum sp.]
MNEITATLRLESTDLALTETVGFDETATVKPLSSAGTADLEVYLYLVRTDDFDRFETALKRDHTVDSFERVVERGEEAVYRLEYSRDALVFSRGIAQVDGISLDWVNDGTKWTVRVWLPEREALASLWEYADEHDIEFKIVRVTDDVPHGETEHILTDNQREALLLALEMGYFEEPRAATLTEVAGELGISQPSAGGRLRRGLRRLVSSTVKPESEEGI